jgi:BirA family transcriptional regulator, biotin operon repressor / biotin---[acetyl-CoA-carboxylase] ligase
LILATGHRVAFHDEVDSTNAEARRLAEHGEGGPLWIVAAKQSAGRGRLGRQWHSPPGNLYATFLHQPAASPIVASQLGFVAALAVRDLGAELRPLERFQLKWPNDVLMNGAKFCGLLSEIVWDSPLTVALGCGLNLAHAPQGLPYPVAWLGPEFAPELILPLLDQHLLQRLREWDEGREFAAIRGSWQQQALGLGAMIEINGLSGIFEGLAEDGGLILKLPDGTRKLVHAGDARLGVNA